MLEPNIDLQKFIDLLKIDSTSIPSQIPYHKKLLIRIFLDAYLIPLNPKTERRDFFEVMNNMEVWLDEIYKTGYNNGIKDSRKHLKNRVLSILNLAD